MTALACYRVRPRISGTDVVDFEQVLDRRDYRVEESEIFEGNGFRARAYIVNEREKAVSWAPLLNQGFPDLPIALSRSPSALLLVQLTERRRSDHPMFAFAFGTVGRYLLRYDAYQRGYGIRTALNLIYPRTAGDSARLRGVDSKRRGETIIRARVQTSGLADFESFDINRLRDVLDKATGVPADRQTWGHRVGGSDALMMNVELDFRSLGQVCRRVEAASQRSDYKDRFDFIDQVQPVNDPVLVERLEAEVLALVGSAETTNLDLSPPEIVDWDRTAGFRYHFDRPQGRSHSAVTHPEMRLADYLTGIGGTARGQLDVQRLRNGRVFAVDGDGQRSARWSVWKCLVGEVELDGDVYVLDEGDFYRVRQDYLTDLDTAISGIGASSADLPACHPSTLEAGYNEAAAEARDLLVLDQKTVRIESRTTAIEICDLLSSRRQFIHVKRHLGSSDLSHLFAQGLVSAELLQSNVEYRAVVKNKIADVAAGRDGFDFVAEEAIATSQFEVVYAIAAAWNGRTPAQALPFFSKVNLREVATNLRSRGFRVCLDQIHLDSSTEIVASRRRARDGRHVP